MYPSYKHDLSDKPPENILCFEDKKRIQQTYGEPKRKVKIYDDNGFIVRVKPIEKNKIKILVENPQ